MSELANEYNIHGVGLAVRGDTPAVLEALELRLRDFRTDAPLGSPMTLEFITGVDPPATAPAAGSSRPVYDTPHGSLHYFPDADALCGQLAGVRLRCDPSRGVAAVSAAAFDGADLYLATHPLTTITLMEMLKRRGLFSLHAACLATADGRGVLLAGPSGAGKSTLALALVQTQMSFLSDDVVFLSPNGGREPIGVLGFADAIGVTEQTAERFDFDEPGVLLEPADGFPKRLRRIDELFTTSPISACAPHALVFPQVARGRPSAVGPLDAKEALLRLVPDVLLTETAATQSHLAAIATLLDHVSCYEVASGSDLEHAADLVRALV